MPEIASTTRKLPPTKPTGQETTTVYAPPSIKRRLRILPVLATLSMAAIGAGAVWILWQAYMGKPWTRDGTVRAYVVSVAPEVSGRVVELPINDNQFVHKGDLLMKIDPRDFQVAVELAKAGIKQAEADLANKNAQQARRNALTDLATSVEEKQTYTSAAEMAEATLAQQNANLTQANINLERTELRSPVNGWITNLLIRQGDYARAGQQALSIVDSDSFWLDGYFEETALKQIRDGDPAKIWLLGYNKVLHGRVDSVARGIVVSNATPGNSGLATVNPIFTWVRLAQRVPVRIHFDDVPEDLRLVIGMTATIEVQPKSEGAKPGAHEPEPQKPDVQKPDAPKPAVQVPEAEKPTGDKGSDGEKAQKSEKNDSSAPSDKNRKSDRHHKSSAHVY
ncbi:efflux RND transporter periplasmic adaptor subunit [Hyphomicrobium sp.]|uniref:efflux RND transporter periplasmic adaptor subunit n=1 Tax=Hyphomicrobium sp. TaxID=82 RepID=UPI000FC08C84|nr:efflux RND transporter periplasmic adaptor subunit [Hyphomicrobium sp.]RUP09555.1 MAG: HlyD family secretion protein [Hyphomicrobium sp.]